MAKSVLTIQSHVRGFLARKQLLPIRSAYEEEERKEKKDKHRKEKYEEDKKDEKVPWQKAKLISAIGSQLSEDKPEAEDAPGDQDHARDKGITEDKKDGDEEDKEITEDKKDGDEKEKAESRQSHRSDASSIRRPKSCSDPVGSKEEEAAIIIQSHFRGYKARCEWGPVLEERLKLLVQKHIDNPEEAEKALEEEGLSPEEAASIIQKFWGRFKSQKAKEQNLNLGRYTNSKKMTDLIMFSQNVHLANQEVHQNLRRSKAPVRLDDIGPAPSDYVRPKGFDQIPQLIHEQRKKGPHQQPLCRPKIKVTRPNSSVSNYYDMIQQDYRDPTPEFDEESSWDAPIASKILPGTEQREPDPKVDVSREKLQELGKGLNQNKKNLMREEDKVKQFQGLVAVGAAIQPAIPKGRSTPTTNMQAASDLRQMLRSAKAPVQEGKTSPEAESEPGPYNFQQFLRKTNYAPTDTIRKRKARETQT